MTILQSLAAFYDRLELRGRGGPAIVPPPGLKPVVIDYLLEIDFNGRPIGLKKRHVPDGRKRAGKLMMPGTVYNPDPKTGQSTWEDLSFGGRTVGRRSFVFWDKTSYVFGVAAKKSTEGGKAIIEPEMSKKSGEDHAAFVAAHRALLAETEVPEFHALLRFLESWTPEQWVERVYPPDALDRNIAFEVSGKRMRLDQMPKARELAASVLAARTSLRHCLITGEVRPYAARHPQFKGVAGAQSAGAPLVSYNADAFVSFDADKAATAPVSEEAAFKYGAALNWLLDRDNGRVFRLGETTVVFWADEKSTSGGDDAARDVEETFRSEMTDSEAPVVSAGSDEDADDDDDEDRDIDAEDAPLMQAQAQDVRHQRRAPDPSKLDKATRMHVLGLSPNAGRIAVRFWLVDTWGHLAANIDRFKQVIAIDPPDRNPDKKAYALLFETASQGKPENIPKRLGGELARAILTGGPYPHTLLTSIIGRIRADKRINAARVGLCKAVIARNFAREDFPVALDPANTNAAYRLGRLFALIEGAQKAALPGIKATVKDKYFGAACATPARVFPLLHKNAMNHLAAVRKERGPGLAHWMDQEIGAVWAGLADELPRLLRLEEQGRFIAGYYHQRYTRAANTPAEAQQILASDPEDTNS
jgi:CRISPR-associated protein Csd1